MRYCPVPCVARRRPLLLARLAALLMAMATAFPPPATATAEPEPAPAATATAALAPPREPVVRRAPATSSWTVTYSYKDASASAEGATPRSPGEQLQSMTVTKSGRTVWEQSLWTSGRRSEKWFLEGVQFQILPGSADMALVPRPDTNANDQSYFDYSDADFPELKGLSLQHYKGVQSHEGKPAYAFAWERGGESMTVLLSETQLPLLLTRKVGNHTITQTYAFAAGAPARLAVPERLRKLLQAHKRGLQALSRTPSPP